MFLLLALWLCCIYFTNQDICHAPGELPAPQLFLAKASSEEGDTVVLKCKVPALSVFTRVIFCKDGKDLASQPMQESKFAFDHKVKEDSAGRFTCLYQLKDHQNQEKNSLLSATQNLHIPVSLNYGHENWTQDSSNSNSTAKYRDETFTSNRTISGVQSFSNGFSSKLILGITVPSLLAVGVVCSFLARKVLSKWREARKPSPREEDTKSPDDLLEYATITGFARVSGICSQPSKNMVVTYATISHRSEQKASHLPVEETNNDLHPYATDFDL